ncbi:MAG: ABC transporter substrate binding protein [Desulfobacteraceae bacterium]
MSKMKPYFVAILYLLVFFSVFSVAQAASRYNIAIVQHQQFAPFQQAHDAFVHNMKILGKDGDYRIVEDYNANSNIKALESKIKELANAGIIKNWKSSGANFTGVETPEYYGKVVRLMHHFVSFKSLGMIYLQGSPSHEAGIRQIRKLSAELGFKFVSRGFPLRNKDRVPFPRDQIRNNMQSALEVVCPQVEAFFVQTSNTFTKEFDLFRSSFLKHRIISAGDPTNIKKGLVMGIGKDADRFGRQCAQYAITILNGTAPAALPMDVGIKLTVDVNLKAAEMINYAPPFELISGADNLYQKVNLSATAAADPKSQ